MAFFIGLTSVRRQIKRCTPNIYTFLQTRSGGHYLLVASIHDNKKFSFMIFIVDFMNKSS